MSAAEPRLVLGLLALDGAVLSSLAGPMDILRIARQVAALRDAVSPPKLETVLIDPDRNSQAPYLSLALAERPRHSLSEKAEHFLLKHLHRDLAISELAQFCDTSERSLLRHFRQHHGASPLAHLQRLRVERAKALLETTLLSFEEIVERCGYSDASSFRKLFKRATSLTPADYRERFRLRAA